MSEQATDFSHVKTDPRKLALALSEVDRAVRAPSIFFICASVIWLLLGSAFALIAAIKLHSPEFLGGSEILTFGRVRSAHLNSVGYGWATNIAFGVSIWVMCRLCRVRLPKLWLMVVAGVFYNIAVGVGVVGILTGYMTSVEWLEMPQQVAPVIVLSYLGIGIWGILAFVYRKSEHTYVSQWYMLAALFWFPWLYTAAQIMLFIEPARGVVQSLTNWWFAHNVLGLWLTPMGVGTAYYLIPKVLGVRVHSYYLSLLGFWSLALFYNWAGVHHLIGGPVPAWVVSAGTVASIMMIIPVLVTGINHHMTVVGNFKKAWASPTMRFVVYGAMNYTLASFFGSAMAIRTVNLTTHFTHFTVGHAHQGAYGFYTMIMFGAIYYMLPRLLRREWPSAGLIKLHFWSTAIGITAMVIVLSWGGWIQGMEMNNADIPFMDTVRNTIPYMIARSVTGVLLTIGHITFAAHIVWMLFLACTKKPETRTGPVSFAKDAA